MPQYFVDVFGPQLRRARVGEAFHPIDELRHAIDLGDDEVGQFASVAVETAGQQLRGAADARQRILDLVRQHRRHAYRRSRRALMLDLPVNEGRHRPRLKGNGQPAGAIDHRRDQHIGTRRALADEPQRDVIRGAAAAFAPGAFDEQFDRAARAKRRRPAAFGELRLTGIEEDFGGDVGDHRCAVVAHQHGGDGEAGEELGRAAARDRRGCPHAASRSVCPASINPP